MLWPVGFGHLRAGFYSVHFVSGVYGFPYIADNPPCTGENRKKMLFLSNIRLSADLNLPKAAPTYD